MHTTKAKLHYVYSNFGAFKSSIIRRGKVFPLKHWWLLSDDIRIHDEAKIWSFQNFQVLDDSYEESDKKDYKVS